MEEKSGAAAAAPPVTVSASGVNTLVPKRKAPANGMPPRQAVNILQPVYKKGGGDKKRIVPVLVTTASASVSTPVLSASAATAAASPTASSPTAASSEPQQSPTVLPNAASKENHIRNILGPSVSPTVSDVHLLNARMTGALTATGLSPHQMLPGASPDPTDDDDDDGNNSSSSATASAAAPSASAPALSAPAAAPKPDPKKSAEQVSLKRKRDGERAAASAAASTAQAVASKARELAPRAPKVLNSRYGSSRCRSVHLDSNECCRPTNRVGMRRCRSESASASGAQLMPEFPFRLQFTAEIDTSGSSTSARTGAAASSTAVVEVNVHNAQSSASDEVVGTCCGDRSHVWQPNKQSKGCTH